MEYIWEPINTNRFWFASLSYSRLKISVYMQNFHNLGEVLILCFTMRKSRAENRDIYPEAW